ncbi:xylulokinase [Gryllotalpicola reticulitermitis]|uniref:Xylulokinase n=1 Tax=Gryllotalpicola reticulitermitis TaxID=1184153 RepID=A0ABV8Q4B7_9MICO
MRGCATAAQAISGGRASLGVEFGSTRVKACLIGPGFEVLATGAHEWQNELVDGRWSYPLDAVWSGLQAAYSELADEAQQRHGVRPATLSGIGISAMMHGYLAFDGDGELLVPFRTWRNTSTGPAAAELSDAFGFNIPLRWSIAHLYQAVLDGESHVGQLASLTTLAGFVHRKLTGRSVLGVGDASGMFPIDPETGDYDERMLAAADELIGRRMPGASVRGLLPEVLSAGADAGRLTDEGAKLLDLSGTLEPGIRFAPPEGDAGTGMVATNSVARRTGNVSVGTSVFAMVVLERALSAVHEEIDVVATPDGLPVAMVHCNNGASELGAWASVFREFAVALSGGHDVPPDHVFSTLITAALDGAADGGGLLSYNFLSGEPVAGVDSGRPLVVRTSNSRLTLANFMRTQLYGVFATLSLGMRVLESEHVAVDQMFAHGGLFRTPVVAQRLLATALGAPVAVGDTAAEGGAWGAAVLAAYLEHASDQSLAAYLAERVFASAELTVEQPDDTDAAGFAAYLERFRAGLAIEHVAADALSNGDGGADSEDVTTPTPTTTTVRTA